jgi:hypothetical protein
MWTDTDLGHLSKADMLDYVIRKRMGWNLQAAKARCNSNGTEFDIELEDLAPYPIICPVLGVELDWLAEGRGGTDYSPSLDRLDPTRGYIKGNVAIISNKANRIKNDGNIEEVAAVLRWLEIQKGSHIDHPVFKRSVQ